MAEEQSKVGQENAAGLVGLVGLGTELVELVDAAVMAVDLEGRIIYANRHTERLYGRSPEEMVGCLAAEFAAVAVQPAVEAEIAGALAEGRSWEGVFDVRRKDGSILPVHAIDSPLYDSSGALVGILSIGLDASGELEIRDQLARQTRAAESFRFLAECTAVLASSLDFEESSRQLVRLSVPFLADLCIIDVADRHVIRRVAAAHADPARQALVDELRERFPPDPLTDHPAIQAMRLGTSTIWPELTPELRHSIARDPQHLAIVDELGYESLVCVPLAARGHVLGALTLVSCHRARRFGGEDLALAKDLGWRAALALDNARLYAERSNVARVLQAGLLPPSLPEIEGLELAARYVAAGEGAEVGGDFYDVFDTGYRTWGVAVGDVCGRGPEAAAVTGLVRHTVHTLSLREREPGVLLGSLNEVLHRELGGDTLFCTLCFGLLRRQRRNWRLTLGSAGHPPPVVLRRTGAVETVTCQGRMLGPFAEGTWAPVEVMLAPGDVAVFYTDGVTEARRSGELFGETRLAAAAVELGGLNPQALADGIVERAERFAGTPSRDDMAVLVVRVSG